MKKLTSKAEIWAEVETILNSYKMSKECKEALTELLKPKAGGGVVQNPMKVVDGTNYHYCRYTGYYLPESEMVMSAGKCKGYSKKAIALWTKLGKDAQAKNDLAMKALLNGDVTTGTELATEAEALKQDRNSQDSYDSVRELYEDIKLEA